MKASFTRLAYYFLSSIFLMLLSPSVQANADKVTLQLRWMPQFQFAGYYMAQAKGFYSAEGIEVKIIPGNGNRTQVMEEVLTRRADFGIGNSGLALAAMEGDPVTVVADIFQRSAAVLITRPGYEKSIESLGHKNLALRALKDNPELYAIFDRNGIPAASLKNVNSGSYALDDFIANKADGINAYLSNEPYLLKEKGVPFSIVDPTTYGINFYGDAIFANSSFVKNNPELTKRFVRASLKGWAYALDHMDEAIDYLHQGPAASKSKAHLTFEAKAIKSLVMIDYVPLGQVSEQRWNSIATEFKALGLAPAQSSIPDSFYLSYWIDREDKRLFWISVTTGSIFCFITLCFSAWYIALNRRLRTVMREKEDLYLEVQKHAHYDDLTLLPNRRLLYDRIEQVIQKAKRKNSTFAICLIDLNNFKKINDHYGHLIGDQVLMELGSRLLATSRGSDSIGRYGGDEFIVILEDYTVQSAVSEYMNRLKGEIDKPIIINDAEFHVSLSYGVAFYPTDGASLDELILVADQRMYRNKNGAKNE